MSRIVALMVVLLAPGVASASSHDAAQAGFVTSVVDAINTPEIARAAALLHPKSLVCPSEYEAAMSFFDPLLGTKGPVPPTYTWRMEEAPAGPPMFSDRVGYPVRPSHLLHITYETRPNASTTLIVQTVRDAERWYVTAFCPKPGTRAQIDAARAAAPRVAAERAHQVQGLITGMPPALKQQILDLVKQGQKISAIRHYEREAGVDLTTAKDVVDRLIERDR
jgi:ribosomal protein L7/L12